MIIRSGSSVVKAIASGTVGSIESFNLIDVGASGGFGSYWNIFGDTLRGVGFDPLVANMRKMAAEEKRPGIRFEAAFVGCRNREAAFPPERGDARIDPYPYVRSSSVKAQELARLDYVSQHFNDGEPAVFTDVHVTLDEYFAN